jgi:fibronectin type 3 domain-containing protein
VKGKLSLLALLVPLLLLGVLLLFFVLGGNQAQEPGKKPTAQTQGDPATAASEPPAAQADPAAPATQAGTRSVLGQSQPGRPEPSAVLTGEPSPSVLASLPEPPADFAPGEGLKRMRVMEARLEPPAHWSANPKNGDDQPQETNRTFIFELFPGTTFYGEATHYQQIPSETGEARGTYSGTISGYPGSVFTLAYNSGYLSAGIMIPGRGEFVLQPAGREMVRVGEIDRSYFAPCRVARAEPEYIYPKISPSVAPGRARPAGDTPLKRTPTLRVPGGDLGPLEGGSIKGGPPQRDLGTPGTTSPAILEALEDATPPPTGEASVPVVDLLIVYTPSIITPFDNRQGLLAEVDNQVAFTNTAYRNSEAAASVRAAEVREIDYVESGDISADLSRLRLRNDGFLDEVYDLRDDASADLVCLLVNRDTSTSGGIGSALGIAYLITDADPDLGFSVVRPQFGPSTFAHEIGHNYGCQHDRENAASRPGAKPYAFGWRFEGDSGNTWRTIMAYAPGDRIPHFSNPDITFDGKPTGVGGTESGADNARRVGEGALVSSGFSEAPSDPNPAGITAPQALRASQGEFPLSIVVEWVSLQNAAGYNVFRSETTDFDDAQLRAFVPQTTFPFIEDVGVSVNERYYYWVQGVSATSEGPLSGPAEGWTQETDVPACDWINAAEGQDEGFVRVTWPELSKPRDYILQYEVAKSKDPHMAEFILSVVLPSYTRPEYKDPVEGGDRFYYWIRAVYTNRVDSDEVIYGAWTGPDLGYPKQPPLPGSIGFLRVTNGYNQEPVKLSWGEAAHAENYLIERSQFRDALIKDSVAIQSRMYPPEFKDHKAPRGVKLYYWVRALNSTGAGPIKGPVEGYNETIEPPGKPSGVTASGDRSDHIVVRWNAANGADSYQIVRNTEPNYAEGKTIATDLLYVRNYKDDSEVLRPSITYYYWVAAVKNGIIGTPGGPAEGSLAEQPPFPPDTVTASDGEFADFIKVEWDESPGADKYRVYRWLDEDETEEDAEEVADTSERFFDDSDTKVDEVYRYAVKAVNERGAGDLSKSDTGFRFGDSKDPPFAPRNVQATDGTIENAIRITWNGSSRAVYYGIYWSVTNDFSTAFPIAFTVYTSYLDDWNFLQPLQEQYYWIVAINAAGSSPPSIVEVGFAGISEDPPTLTELSNNSLPEEQPAGYFIGTFSTEDESEGDVFTYTLPETQEDNEAFQIVGNQLLSAEVLDFEEQETYDILVRTTDLTDQTLDTEFTIQVVDIQELPGGPGVQSALVKLPNAAAADVSRMVLTWPPDGGKLYQLQKSLTLEPSSWENIGEPTTGNSFTVPVADSTCFFRVIEVETSGTPEEIQLRTPVEFPY